MALKLGNVTICAADSAYLDLTAKALTLSQAKCSFADAILFSDGRADGPFRCVEIRPLRSVWDYSDFCLTDLPHLIQTDYALIVQWDGYVVDPSRWRPSFLKFDYIGAVWGNDFHNVGNGGFSLRSRKLLAALKSFPLLPGHFEDQAICRLYRPRLESEFGIRFADAKLASRFSYEFGFTNSFGFHGFHNMWRYLPDDEVVALAGKVWREGFSHWKSVRLIVDAWSHDRRPLALAVYRLLRQRLDYASVCKATQIALPDTEATLRELEALQAA